MKKYTSSEARKRFREIISDVKETDVPVGVGRYDRVEVLIIRYPEHLNADLSDVTNVNANSRSFSFLSKEPDLYSVDDLMKKYV
jgi:hypothetical protein